MTNFINVETNSTFVSLHTSNINNDTLIYLSIDPLIPPTHRPSISTDHLVNDTIISADSSLHIQQDIQPKQPSHNPSSLSSSIILTRFKTGHSKPKHFPDYKFLYSTHHPRKLFSCIFNKHEWSSYSKVVTNSN